MKSIIVEIEGNTICDICTEHTRCAVLPCVGFMTPMDICADCLRAAIAALEAAKQPKEGLRGA